jgi:hypothetical protein
MISLIILSNVSTIQFRLAFKDKGHKSLEYWGLVIHLPSVRLSTISYAESNGGIFILIMPLLGIRELKHVGRQHDDDGQNKFLQINDSKKT